MMMISLSDAVAPTTSSGVAFFPSGMTCGLGLSMVSILDAADNGDADCRCRCADRGCLFLLLLLLLCWLKIADGGC